MNDSIQILTSSSSLMLGNENGDSHCSHSIKTFNHEQFGEIRCLQGDNGEPWFVGKDVAMVLGYAKPQNALAAHVDEDDKTTALIQGTGSNYKTQATLINESGLYSLILSSKLPQAREFKRWVTSVVLPQIRRTGGYIPLQDEDDEKTILAKALMISQKTIEQKETQLEQQRPLVQFAEAVTATDDCILIGELAKLITRNGYEIGRTRLFRWLREHGYLFKHSNEPIQKWVERGLFQTHVTLVTTHHGQQESLTTKVTGKGQQYFLDKFISLKQNNF